MISPGASYTLEMVYNGSGNRNKVVGDSIFHCHFYPHFAAGMWAMWRTHDVFEAGSQLNKDGIPVSGTRALPDGEIRRGRRSPRSCRCRRCPWLRCRQRSSSIKDRSLTALINSQYDRAECNGQPRISVFHSRHGRSPRTASAAGFCSRRSRWLHGRRLAAPHRYWRLGQVRES